MLAELVADSEPVELLTPPLGCRVATGQDGGAWRPAGQRVSVHQRVCDEDHQRSCVVSS